MLFPLLLSLISADAVDHPSGAPRTTSQPFMCDAQPGHYDRRELALAPGENVLRARIRLLQVQPHENWAPAAGLLFVLPGERRYAGVQVFVDPLDPSQLTVGLKKPRNDSPTPVLRISPSEPVEVIMQFADGVVTVWAGDKSKSLRLGDKAIEGAFVMCSSGQFEIAL